MILSKLTLYSSTLSHALYKKCRKCNSHTHHIFVLYQLSASFIKYQINFFHFNGVSNFIISLKILFSIYRCFSLKLWLILLCIFSKMPSLSKFSELSRQQSNKLECKAPVLSSQTMWPRKCELSVEKCFRFAANGRLLEILLSNSHVTPAKVVKG